MYYDLVRELLGECCDRMKENRERDRVAEIEHLNAFKEIWLNSPNPETSGRVPAEIIDLERKRVNLISTTAGMPY